MLSVSALGSIEEKIILSEAILISKRCLQIRPMDKNNENSWALLQQICHFGLKWGRGGFHILQKLEVEGGGGGGRSRRGNRTGQQ